MIQSNKCSNKQTTVIVVRTHYFDKELSSWASDIKALGFELVFVVDETHGIVEIDNQFKKLVLNNDVINKLGLLLIYNVGWQCGDYSLYIAKEHFPHASHFWLVEPDVYFNMKNKEMFFEFFEKYPDIDFLSALFRPAKPSWYWHAPMKPFATTVHRCLFY